MRMSTSMRRPSIAIPSLPGLTRQSSSARAALDHRVEPGGDVWFRAVRIPALALCAAVALSAPALADGHELSDAQMAAIEAMLADMRCEVTGEIEVEDGEIELDDVICAGGQFDFEMNEDFHITGARGE